MEGSHRFSHPELLATVAGELRAAGESLAVILVNVWNAAEIEARIGFEASERLGEEIERRLIANLRGRASVRRFGDAGFAVLVGAVKNSGHASLAAEKVWRLVAESPGFESFSDRPEVHVGISLYPLQASDPAQLIRQAQLAGASARERGVRTLIYDEDCAGRLLGRWGLESELAQALHAGEIEMYYQPKVRIASREPGGAEALMRWMKEGELVASPDVFIPLAESGELIRPATRYALNTALRQLREWPLPLGVAVNVSPAMVHDAELIDIVRGALGMWNVAGERLTLEITEGALAVDPERAMTKLASLRELGVRISIDDFGTGYSSLSYFRKLPADELKIDKSFITTLLQDEANLRIVRTIVGLAGQFGLAIVAEGVEDEATLAALGEMGCDYAQGYLFSRPLAQRAFVDWLAGFSAGTAERS